jgi:predicted ester cyclase
MNAERSLARRYFEDLFNAGEFALADEILDPQISFGGPIHPAGIQGIEAFKDFILGWYRGFPDRHFEVLEEWVAPDRIATVFHITGTHQGEFLGQAATGNPIDVSAMNYFRIVDGRIRTIQAFFDPRRMLEPLGLAP